MHIDQQRAARKLLSQLGHIGSDLRVVSPIGWQQLAGFHGLGFRPVHVHLLAAHLGDDEIGAATGLLLQQVGNPFRQVAGAHIAHGGALGSARIEPEEIVAVMGNRQEQRQASGSGLEDRAGLVGSGQRRQERGQQDEEMATTDHLDVASRKG